MDQGILRGLSDGRLLEGLKNRVSEESRALADILNYLREVERRKLFLNRGYSSLFAFCMGELAYSESQAHTRIQAMRLIKSVPEAEQKIANGELSLSVAAAAQSAFARSVKQDQPMPAAERKKIVQDLSGLSSRKAEQLLFVHVPASEIPAERTKVVARDLTRIEFNANSELHAKLKKLKGLTAHQNFDGSWEKLIEILADLALDKLEPKPPKPTTPLVKRPHAQMIETPQVQRPDAPLLGTSQVKRSLARSRHIPANIKRVVWQRDRGRCQFKDPVTGRTCESAHGLQLDHVHRFSDGGEHLPHNLRLLCGAHNRLRI